MARKKSDPKEVILQTEETQGAGTGKEAATENDGSEEKAKKSPKKSRKNQESSGEEKKNTGARKTNENLIPLNKRTKDEQRKIAKMGGVKSGESRRRHSDAKKAAEYVSALTPLVNEKSLKMFRQAGLEDPTFTEAIAYVIARKALEKQDVQAARLFFEMAGQDGESRRHRERLDFEKKKYRLEHPNVEKDDLNAQILSIASLINHPVEERTLEEMGGISEETE